MPTPTPIHFRFRGGFEAPEPARFAGFLFRRGVSRFWFDAARGIPAEASTIPGLTAGIATSPGMAGALDSPREVLLEAPCADWRENDVRGEIEELGRAREALIRKGAPAVFIRLIHPDPVSLYLFGRQIKGMSGAPLVVSLEGSDAVADSLSAGPLLAEGLADAVLLDAEPPANADGILEPALESSAARLIERARRILSMLGLHPKGYDLVSCPTCGRCGLDVEGMARETDARMRALEEELGREGKDLERIGGITVAVMGCNVNGPGEARAADIGIAGGKNGRGTLFVEGVPVRTLPEGELVHALMDGVRAIVAERYGSTGEAESASGCGSPGSPGPGRGPHPLP
jgi:hypothetical protein